jgi:hypothetical protein
MPTRPCLSVASGTIAPMPQHIVYKPAERPECEALVDGRWVPAEIRMWVQHNDGTWTADVGYATAPTENRIGTFPADRLRSTDPPTQGAGVDAP